MIIRINGADADIQLETEKTLGDILCGLDTWFAGTGHHLSGLAIDGELVGAGAMEACFARNIDTVDTLDIYTNSLSELLVQSLSCVLQDIDAYTAADFEEKGLFAGQWKQTPQALLLADHSASLYDWTLKTFSGEGAGPQPLGIIVEERLREWLEPAAEIERTGPLVTEVCARLEELPLDVQTGKDARASDTVNAFSRIAEKVFRILDVLKIEGFPTDQIMVENMSVSAYVAEFSTALKELLAAYEQHDTVLIGDIAEYEMAPRLRALHTAIFDAVRRTQ